MKQSVLAFLLLSLYICAAAPVTVHIIPHSHDDAGWLKTMDQYFHDDVKGVLDTVTEQLFNNEKYTFQEVEQVYFQKWWKQASAEQQRKFKSILAAKQIEFINGGWVMHDDAITTYSSMIDQTTMGHHFINDVFGADALPKSGWTVDPFGLSAVTAKLNKLFNMDYHVINRITYSVKDEMKKNANLNFLWRFDPAHNDKAHELFTSVWVDGYCTPMDANWDDGTKPVTDKNVREFADNLANKVRDYRPSFKLSDQHLMFPFGCDFQFTNAGPMFGNMSKIIDYINSNQDRYNLNVKFSKVTDYMKAVYSEQNNTVDYWKKDDDFLPYADNIASFWTGYFVSRAELKNLARWGEAISRSSDVLFALARSYGRNVTYNDNYENLYALRYANGLAQHHDGITGTEKVHVLENYMQYINSGISSANTAASKSLLSLLAKKGTSINGLNLVDLNQQEALLGTLKKGDKVPVVVFNSLGWDVSSTVKTVISLPNVVVTDASNNNKVLSQVIPLDSGLYELSFSTNGVVPAVGFRTFIVHVAQDQTPQFDKPTEPTDQVISNEVYDLKYTNGRITSVKNKKDGAEIRFERSVHAYRSYDGDDQPSGAYIFRTNGMGAPVNITAKPSHHSGPAVEVVTQDLGPYIKETLRLHKSSDADAVSELGEASVIEFNYAVGPLPKDTEPVIRFSTNIKNNRDLLVDRNGLQSYKRAYANFPNDPDFHLYPVASNFQPLVHHATIADDEYQLTVVTNTSRAVASLVDGAIEVLVHRRCSVDDKRGVDTPLDDENIVGVQLRVIIQKKKALDIRPHHAHRANFPVVPFVYSQLDQEVAAKYAQLFNTDLAPLAQKLPQHVHLLTLAQQSVVGQERTLLRLVNLKQFDSSVDHVNVDKLFKDISVKTKVETTLNGIEDKAKQPRDDVAIEPLDIKTFRTELGF